jgi:hypothetical protein
MWQSLVCICHPVAPGLDQQARPFSLPHPKAPAGRDADYGFEYSDDDMSEGAVDIENQYYNSKGALRVPPTCLSVRRTCHTEDSEWYEALLCSRRCSSAMAVPDSVTAYCSWLTSCCL